MPRRRDTCPRWMVPLLGRLPDPELAREASVALITVRRWRYRRGIAKTRSRRATVKWWVRFGVLAVTKRGRLRFT